jgi:uncharacterized membrane protein
MAMSNDHLPNPTDQLKSALIALLSAFGNRAVSSASKKVQGVAGRLTDYVDGGGGPGLAAAVTGIKDQAEGKGPVRSLLGAGQSAAKEAAGGLLGKGGGQGGGGQGGGGKNLKVTNIVESIDVGAPIHLVYNQWTQFADFPSFMKKIESVEQEEEQTLNWRAQILWSHRNWKSTIQKQVPDDKIIWRSEGAKGYVDGVVTFHELAPRLTRILMVLEYHPQGFFEHTGNIWRAQGRRARLELKHFRRHVMSQVLLESEDEVEGWRGVIDDGEVVKDHETAVKEEEQASADHDGRAPAQKDDNSHGRADSRKRADSRERGNGRGRRDGRGRGDGSGRPAPQRQRRPARGGNSRGGSS